MKMTLLEMTQNILDAMDSDEVNAIGDTTESRQVAGFVKEAYFDLVAQRDWPFLKFYGSLTALGDVSHPTKMEFPTNVDKVYWIKYNKKEIKFLDPKTFQNMLDLRSAQTGVIDLNGYIINADPVYWTTFDDNFVYMDGYDSSVDTTLQASKSTAYMLLSPDWTHEDEFTPTLPNKMFPQLLADAKGTSFLNMKQTAHQKEERKSQRLRVRMQKESTIADPAETKTNLDINYGRN